MSAEPPQIVIRTAEERLAEEAAASPASPNFRVFETLDGDREMTLGLKRTEGEEGEEELRGKSWWFHDRDDAYWWLLLRDRELSSEGMEVSAIGDLAALSDHHAFTDARTSLPLRRSRYFTAEQMLEW